MERKKMTHTPPIKNQKKNKEVFTAAGKQVKCPICSKNTALEEKESSTISWMCVSCGYTTTTLYRKGSPALRYVLSTSPQLIRDKQFFDEERSIVWIPAVIRMKTGIVYPEMVDEDLVWFHAAVIEIPEEEQQAYPVPGQEGKFYDSRLAVENAKKFDRFYDALKSIGAILTIPELENKNA